MLINFAAIVVIIAGIMSAKSLIIPFLLAAFLSIICAPPLYWLRTKGVPPFLSIIILVFGLVMLEIGVASMIGSSLTDFSKSLPLYESRLQSMLSAVLAWLSAHGMPVTDQIFTDQFNPGKIMGMAANTLNKMGGLLTNTFMIILTFVFILFEAAGFPDKLRAVAGRRDASLQKYAEITKGVNRYMALKTFTSLLTGVLVTASLKIIGVDFAVMWGLVAFLLNFVPTIGSIIAAVPAVLLALVQLGAGAAAGSAVSYLVINVIIGNIVEPKIMGSGVGLSPLVIFVSMAFWGWVLGPVGMLLSVPLTMTLKIVLASNEKTRWLALLLGSNSDARAALRTQPETSYEEN